MENQLNAITCPETGKQLEYRHLIQSPATKQVWNPAMSTEVDRLVKTKTIRFIKKCDILRGEKAVYTRIVVDLRPKKAVHEQLRLCMGGDQMVNAMRTTTRITILTACKLHVNSVVSTPGAKIAGVDIQDFYLETPLKNKQYGKVRAKYIPQETIDKYNLAPYIDDDGWLYFEIDKGMYGISEAGMLANDLLT